MGKSRCNSHPDGDLTLFAEARRAHVKIKKTLSGQTFQDRIGRNRLNMGKVPKEESNH